MISTIGGVWEAKHVKGGDPPNTGPPGDSNPQDSSNHPGVLLEAEYLLTYLLNVSANDCICGLCTWAVVLCIHLSHLVWG